MDFTSIGGWGRAEGVVGGSAQAEEGMRGMHLRSVANDSTEALTGDHVILLPLLAPDQRRLELPAAKPAGTEDEVGERV